MPIYTAEEVRGNMKATPALELRGLSMRAKAMTQVDPVGTSDYPQTAYQSYINHLPAFLWATVKKEATETFFRGYKFNMKSGDQIPLSPPSVVVSFEDKLSAEEDEAMKNLGADVLEVKDGKEKTKIYRFKEGLMDAEILKVVLHHDKGVIDSTQTVVGQANLNGYLAFLTARSLLTAFLQTQHYPAFTEPRDPPKGAFDDIKGLVTLKRAAYDSAKRTNDVKRARMAARAANNSQLAREDQEMDSDIDWEDLDFDEYTVDYAKVPKASPPTEVSLGYGTSDLMPSTYGNLFPYFPSLLDDDNMYVAAVCREYFLLSFGQNPKQCSENYILFKQRLGQFASSSAGRILTHVFSGVRLAIQTQTRLFVHLGALYNGYSLHGAMYHVTIGSRVYEPLSAMHLAEEALSIDEHTVALTQILQVVADSRGAKQKKLNWTPKNVTGPRMLSAYVRKATLTSDEVEIIDKASSHLVFPQTFWKFTLANVLEVVRLLSDEDCLPDDAPEYIAGGILTSHQEELHIFAVFGDQGFSFLCPGGKSILVPSKINEDTVFASYIDPKTKKKVNRSQTLVLAKKGVRQCREDWIRFLKNRAFVNREQRSSVFRSEVFGGENAKALWYGIIERLPEMDGGDTEPIVKGDVVKPAGEKVTKTRADFDGFL